jgi:putative two-component system response regulator
MHSCKIYSDDPITNQPVTEHPLPASLGHVLVVDDDATTRHLMTDLLQSMGYQVTEAENGIQALDNITFICPDLILLDVFMPGLTGYELCFYLKSQPETRLIPIILLTNDCGRQARLRSIEVGSDDFLTKPFDETELRARVRSLVHQKHLNDELDHASQALFAIAQAVERRDLTTGNHCERLMKGGQAFGQWLNLSSQQLKTLLWGSYLHDIGKIAIPDAILNKPGKHTPEEWAIMQSHVLVGEEICRPLRSMKEVLPLIRHHHERWNGTGYPDQLKGDSIPFIARVFQIIDIYDALIAERPYKPAYSSAQACEILLTEAQQGWRDPELVLTFISFIKSYDPSGSELEAQIKQEKAGFSSVSIPKALSTDD